MKAPSKPDSLSTERTVSQTRRERVRTPTNTHERFTVGYGRPRTLFTHFPITHTNAKTIF